MDLGPGNSNCNIQTIPYKLQGAMEKQFNLNHNSVVGCRKRVTPNMHHIFGIKINNMSDVESPGT